MIVKGSGSPCQEYITNHVEPLIEEYKNREHKKKREFFGWQMAILITGVSISIVNAAPLEDTPWVRLVSTLFGAAVAVITGLTQLLRAHELWVVFGLTHVRLDSELKLYKNQAGVYANSTMTPEELCKEFVKNFEVLRMEAAQQSWTIASKKH